MATVNNLGFAITSSWDSAGMEAARNDIERLQAQISALTDERVSIDVTVTGVSQAQAQVDEAAKGRDSVISVSADASEARASIDEAAAARTASIKASADTAEAHASLDDVSKPREILLGAVLEGLESAQAELDDVARDRHPLLSVMLDASVEEAQARMDDLARDRKATVTVDSDDSSLSGVGDLLKEHTLLVGGLSAAFVGLGAVAAVAGAAMMTALGGGIIAAGMAVIEMNKKMTDSQNQAAQSARDQARTSAQAVVDAQQNVTDTAIKGAESVKSANQGVVDAQQNVADTSIKSAESVASANQAVTNSQQNVTDTAIKGAEAIQSANQAVSAAQQGVSDTAQQGADSIRSANEEAASANQSLRDSQVAVGQAYQDSQRNLQDLQLQQSQSGDNAEAAAIAVQRARDKLAQGPSKTSKDPALDQRANQNDLALAIDHQNSVLEKNGQLNQDANKATAQGLDGSQKVIAAKQKEADAAQKVSDANTKVGEAQQKSAEDNAKAQQTLGDAQQKASDAQRTSAENNAKAQQDLADSQQKDADAQREATEANTKAAQNLADSQQKAADAQREATEANQKAAQQLTEAQIKSTEAQNNLNKVLAKGSSQAHELLAQLAAMAQPLVGPVHDAMASLSKQLEDMGPQITKVFANAAPMVMPFVNSLTGGLRTSLPGITTALKNMQSMMPGFQSGMTQLGSGVGAMFDKMSDSAQSFGKIVNDFGGNFGHFLDLWGGFIKDTGPQAAITLDHMGQGINSLTQGVLGGETGAIKNMSGKPSTIQALMSGVGGVASRALPAAGTMTGAIGSTLAPAIQAVTPAMGDALGGAFSVGASAAKAFGPGLDTAAKAINNIMERLKPVIPLIQAFVSGMGGTFSLEMKLLAPILEAIAIPLADILKGLVPLAPILGVVVAAVKTWTIAMAALDLVMDANPIVLIGLAVAALVGGIIYLAEKTMFFEDIWSAACKAVQAEWGALKQVFEDLVTGFINSWEALWNGLQAVWNITSKIFSTSWSAYWNAIRDVWNSLTSWISGTWQALWNGVKDLWDATSKAFQDDWNMFWGAIQLVWDTLGKWFSDTWGGLWAGIKAIFDSFSSVLSGVWNSFWNGIQAVAKAVWDGISQGFKTFGDGLNDGLKGIVQIAGDVWGGIKKVFADPINAIIRISNDTIGKVVSSAHMYPVTLASGGLVPGNGHPRADDVPAMLSSREFVVNAADSQKNLAALHHANSGGRIMAMADGGEVPGNGTVPAISRALDWATSLNGKPYNQDGWIDCSGLASGLYDELIGKTPQREFTTVSNFGSLGFVPGTGGIMEIGVTPLPGQQGHMAITMGGHKLESGGVHDNIAVDGPAVGADDPQFQDHYFLPGNLFQPAYTGPGAQGSGSKGGSFLGMLGHALGGVFGAARGSVADLFEMMTNPILSAIPNVPGVGSPFNTFPKAQATSGRNALESLIAGSAGGAGGPVGGTVPSGDHLKIIDQALAITNTPPPGSKEDWEAGYNTLIGRESSWRPGVAGNTGDINERDGNNSMGLTQITGTNFAQYAVPGYNKDITDPVSNVAASIQYIKARYPGGNVIGNVQQANASMPPKGYAVGTTNASPGMALVGEDGPEMINSKNGSFISMGKQAVNFKGGETVTPLSKLFAPAPAGPPVNAPTSIPAPAPGDNLPAPPPPSGGSQVGTGGAANPNAVLQQEGQQGASALQAFGTANASQAATDLGVPTDGSGFLPQLFTQGFSYGQQLASNIQNHVGIFGPNGGGQGPADTTGKNLANQADTGNRTGIVQGPTDVHFHTTDMHAALKQYQQHVKIQAMGFNPHGVM